RTGTACRIPHTTAARRRTPNAPGPEPRHAYRDRKCKSRPSPFSRIQQQDGIDEAVFVSGPVTSISHTHQVLLPRRILDRGVASALEVIDLAGNDSMFGNPFLPVPEVDRVGADVLQAVARDLDLVEVSDPAPDHGVELHTTAVMGQ